MDLNYHSSRIIAHRSPGGYFAGLQSRQYRSGNGSAIRLGLKGSVLPIAKNSIPFNRTFIGATGPDLLEVLKGSSEPKKEFRSVAKTTIGKQISDGKMERFESSTPATMLHIGVSFVQNVPKNHHSQSNEKTISKTFIASEKPSRRKRTVRRKIAKKTVSRRKSTTANRGLSRKAAIKQCSRNDFVSLIVVVAT